MTARGKLLLPYQARWYALGAGSTAPWRWLEKARRTGMTWTEAVRQAMIASRSRAAGGRDCIYVSTSHVLARKYIQTVATWARALDMAVESAGVVMLANGRDDILAHQVRMESGYTVTGVTSNPAAMRGEGGEVCIDETAHHMRLPDLLEAAFALQRWGGSITCLSTHNGLHNPFKKLGDEIRAGTKRGATMRVDIHDALRDGLYRRVCKMNRRPWTEEGEAEYLADALASPGADQEFLVQPADAGATFYRSEMLEACAHPAAYLHLQRPPSWTTSAVDARTAQTRAWCTMHLRPLLRGLVRSKKHYIGQDCARRVDLSAIYVLAQESDLSLTTPFWIELRNVPYEEQAIIADYLLRGKHRDEDVPECKVPKVVGYAIDVTEGGGANLAEGLGNRWGRRKENEAGLIVEITLSAPWYEREHHRLRARLEERDLQIPRDEDVLEDLQSWQQDERGRIALGPKTKSRRDGLQRHGDVGVALLLAQSIAPDVPQVSKFREIRPTRPRPRGP